MNILITGASGFIGGNLWNCLRNYYDILAPVRQELDLTNSADVRQYLKNNKADCIIHCATRGGIRGVQDAPNTISDNLSMINNLIHYKDSHTKIILFGSGAMYDKSRSLHKVREDEIGRCIPPDLYGRSKMLIAKKIKNREDILCLNIFACYGYGEKETRFPSYSINQILAGKNIEINQNVVFDYLFIDDLVQIVKFFITNQYTSNIINVTPSKSVDLFSIAKILNNFSTNKVNITVKNPNMGMEYTADNSLLLENIPGFVFTPIQTGLKKLYDYKYKNFISKGGCCAGNVKSIE